MLTEFPETETRILAGIKSLADREAWEHFVSIYRPVIYRMARRRGFQEADAQDVTQRVLTSIAHSIHRWKQSDPPIRFRHWLRRVVKNAIINAATRRPKEIALGGSEGDDPLLRLVNDPNTEREIELEYRRELFHRAADIVRRDVQPETWRAFELSVVNGLTVPQTAARLNLSVGSVYAARSRIMRRLKNSIDQLEND